MTERDKANSSNQTPDREGLPSTEEAVNNTYNPPKTADEADRADADLDGTSSSHYGANDPALYEDVNSGETSGS